MGTPRDALSYLFIVCEFHFGLITEFNVALGNFVVHLLQILEEPAIGRGINDFGFNCHLLCPLASALELNLLSGCSDPCCMLIQYGVIVGRLKEIDLLSAGLFLSSFIAILGANVGSWFLHRGAEHIAILALVSQANGEIVPL